MPRQRQTKQGRDIGGAGSSKAHTKCVGVMASSALPLIAESPLNVPRSLPRGLSSLPQEVVLVSQHARLVEGAALAIAEKGYAATTVADIIKQAGVSRATFYQFFKDKEDCFLDCFNKLAASHLRVIAEALDETDSLPKQLCAAVRAYLEQMERDKWLARAFIAEAVAATPAIREALEATQAKMGTAFRNWYRRVAQEYPEIPELPESVFDLMLAGTTGFVLSRVRDNAPAEALDEDVSAMTYFCFSSMGLTGWAKDALRTPPEFGHPLA